MKKIYLLIVPCIFFSFILQAQESQTFQIERLERAKQPLTKTSPQELLSKYESEILCLSMTDSIVDKGTHPVLAGFLQAYQQHRPITLTPDVVWLLICQGFSQHVNHNAEALRNKIVNFEDKKDLIVTREVPDLDITKFPWESVFPEFTEKIGDYTGKQLIKVLTADFTTSTPTTIMASQLTIMNAMKQYFNYKIMMVGCGIPAVTIEGSIADWEKILKRLDFLAQYDLKWWTDEVKPIIKKIIQTKKGKLDKKFWMDMIRFHRQGIYGSFEDIDGWILKFYPYLKSGKRSTMKSIQYITVLPDEIARVPFIFVNTVLQVEYKMEFWVGFLGLSQDPTTLSLKPEIGWAVNKLQKME